MNPRRLAMVPALTVVLAGCVVVWVAGFGSAGIEETAAPIVERASPSLADAEVADSPQTIVLANAAVDSADTAAPTAIHPIAVSRPSGATPNARVADAFGAIRLNL